MTPDEYDAALKALDDGKWDTVVQTIQTNGGGVYLPDQARYHYGWMEKKS